MRPEFTKKNPPGKARHSPLRNQHLDGERHFGVEFRTRFDHAFTYSAIIGCR